MDRTITVSVIDCPNVFPSTVLPHQWEVQEVPNFLSPTEMRDDVLDDLKLTSPLSFLFFDRQSTKKVSVNYRIVEFQVTLCLWSYLRYRSTSYYYCSDKGIIPTP